MNKWLLILSVLPVATLSVHLGLAAELSKVLHKILNCPKCLTFWTTAVAMYCLDCPIVLTISVPLVSAYLSHWFGLLLVKLNWLWQNVNNNLQKRSRK